jgi:phospholipase C
MGIYTASGVLAYKVSGASLNTTLSLSPGTYNTVVQEWDNCGGAAKTPIKIVVVSSISSYPLTVTLTGTGTVTSSPTGISCPATCSAQFPSGAKVTLTATAGTGYSFTSWSGGGCGTAITCTLTMNAAASEIANFTSASAPTYPVTVSLSGPGTVTSSPAGINCPTTCSAQFEGNSEVVFTAVPAKGYAFTDWGGACSGSMACTVSVSGALSVSAGFAASLQSINHIIVFAQENRSFDSYFGALRGYWASNGIADQSYDGLPQFNPSSGSAPLEGPAPAIPGCDPAFPYNPNGNPPQTGLCTIDSSSPSISSFHLQTMCLENPSPSWNESHVDWNLNDNTGAKPALLNGFVKTAANDARRIVPAMMDTNGLRAMGYYDGNDLNYYYYMASQFATSDRWFSPVMSRTQINRMYMLSATSQGHVYPLTTTESQLTAQPIFEALQNAGVTWRIYVHPNPVAESYPTVSCAALDTRPKCLFELSYLNMFTYGNEVVDDPVLSPNLVPVSQFATDAANGTLAQFSFIEPASAPGLDEHPSDYDPTPHQPAPCCSIQEGANFASGIIDSLMNSPSWIDSAMLFTYDEFGGFYDHVPPQPATPPGDILQPTDLLPGDVCTVVSGPTCSFDYTGYRVPLMVVSPYSKKNYVSHQVADLTAMLKLVESRFGVPPLTARDAAQIDMSKEFFDFVNVPWATPPTPPAQSLGGQCSLSPPTP